MPSTEGIGARRGALQLLDAVLRRGSTLDAAAARLGSLSPPDRALAVAIAGETLRRLPDLDSLIDSATRQRLPDDSKARMVLRIALAQKIGLETPDYALVATALPLVDGGPRRLVHGVLGTLLRRPSETSVPPRLPEQVEDRWNAAWGLEAVEAARRQIVRRPLLDLTFADEGEAVEYARSSGGLSLAPNHVRLQSSSVSDLAGYEEGRWWVQDLSASLPARLISSNAVEVLDLCAAPGGKTMQLAAAGHKVTAVDSSRSRLARLAENLARTRLDAKLVEGDALSFEPSAKFDAILLDAPCSATGTFRRHPEVLYRARPALIAEKAGLQAKLLARASRWLQTGGIIVYSVCSLEPEEGEKIVGDFLRADESFTIDPPHGSELPEFAKPAEQGWIRILPGQLESEGGLDSFFIARLVRAH